MQVVRIRHMRMGMPGRRMAVPVAVRTCGRVGMAVQVVSIVVGVGVLMLERIVVMRMGHDPARCITTPTSINVPPAAIIQVADR